MRNSAVLALTCLVFQIGCDSVSGPTEQSFPDLRYSLTAKSNLTDEEEAELDLRARINEWGLTLHPDGISGGHQGPAEFWIWTDASIPFGIFFPRIKQDAVATITTMNGSQIVPFFDDYTLEYNLKWQFHIVNALNCATTDGTLNVQSEHRARWNYFKLGELLKIDRGPEYDAKTESCAQNTFGNGGSGATVTCYKITTDYYWWNLDTGAIEYRYTDTYHYCESQYAQ